MTEQENQISRRDFSNYLMAAGAASLGVGILYPITRYAIPPKTSQQKLSTVAGAMENWPNNTHKIVLLGGAPVIVIRKKDGEFVALGAICTHADCTVTYDREKENILCECHGGKFDLSGKVTGGPPPRPLSSFEVKTRVSEEKKITEVIVSS